jgi:basic amino acid/polyamine antiporter, APA family
VVASVVLRRRYPGLERPFRVPALPLVAAAAIISSLALMATLPGATWIRLGAWALIGICIYFFYAREHSAVKMRQLGAAQAPAVAEEGASS